MRIRPTFVFLALVVPASAALVVLATASVGRIAGVDRSATSVEMAKSFGGWFPTGQGEDFAGDRHQVLAPAGIARVRDQPSADRDPQSVWLGEPDVAHRQGGHVGAAEPCRPLAEHDRPEGIRKGDRPEEVGVERLLRGPKARLERRRSSDDQLSFAPAEVLLDREVGDPPEVVAVKVRDRDRVDRLTVDVLLDRRQGGAAAVEQK